MGRRSRIHIDIDIEHTAQQAFEPKLSTQAGVD